MQIASVLLILLCAAFAQQVQDKPFSSDPAPPVLEVKIVQGPIVEYVTDTTAIIAWSTNVNSGTVLHYGVDPTHLDKSASMPWGGLTHRVNLKDLKPDTKYYFRAEATEGQGTTGTSAQTPQSSFRTKPAATCAAKCA